jgi:hypothetical protein
MCLYYAVYPLVFSLGKYADTTLASAEEAILVHVPNLHIMSVLMLSCAGKEMAA